MSDTLAWMGSYENRLNRAMGRDSEITYADVPKIIIEDMPDDIFEMEELTNLEENPLIIRHLRVLRGAEEKFLD